MRNPQAVTRSVLEGADSKPLVDPCTAIDIAPSVSAHRHEPSSGDFATNGSHRGSQQQSTTLPQPTVPEAATADLALLHSRVIALENLVITLLGAVVPQQLDNARAMAQYILPREDATPHPLTIQAAAMMVQLVDRAVHFGNRYPIDPGSGALTSSA